MNKPKISDKHVCRICKRIFIRAYMLKAHERTHKPFSCYVCGSGFMFKEGLVYHLDKDHNMEYDPKLAAEHKALEYCYISDESGPFLLPKNRQNRRFLCDHCQSTFIFREGLEYHIKSAHGIEDKPIEDIPEEPESFNYEHFLRENDPDIDETQFKTEEPNVEFSESPEQSDEVIIPDLTYTIKVEPQETGTEDSELAELCPSETESIIVKSEASGLFTKVPRIKSSLDHSLVKPPIFQFLKTCPQCFKDFKHKANFLKHMEVCATNQNLCPRIRGRKELFYCNSCTMNFISKKNLLNHEKKEHPPNIGVLSCPYCKFFLYDNMIKEHIENDHSSRPKEVEDGQEIILEEPRISVSKKLWICNVCHLEFSMRAKFLRHVCNQDSIDLTIMRETTSYEPSIMTDSTNCDPIMIEDSINCEPITTSDSIIKKAKCNHSRIISKCRICHSDKI